MYIVAGGPWVSVSIKPGTPVYFFWIPGSLTYWFVTGFMGWHWLTDSLLLRSFAIGLTGIGYCLVILYMGKALFWANCCLSLGFYCVLNGIVLLRG